MRRRTGRDSGVARESRGIRRTRGTQKSAFRKRYAVEWLEQRVLLSATPTNIAVSASSNSVVYGQAVSLTAAVSASPIAPSEGTVVFFDGGTPLGTATVSAGVATLDNVRLPAGADLITASYVDPSGAFASSSTGVGPQSMIETVAGGALPSGLPAVNASVSPRDIAVDASGDLFITDDTLNVVFEVNHATGVIATVAGNGTTGFSGDGGPAAAAELNYPQGVAVDSLGDLFIVDGGNNRIREVDHATGVITTVAGNGAFGFSGDGGPATAAALSAASHIAVDSSGDLFICDLYSHRIREVNHATGVITTVAGNGAFGFSGDGGPATAAELKAP
ncbi:MAG TPA: Ig-like domain repeat protein [Pirellulales bacterium]|nr:Ig-like domain repeat protein [Pirellulales bacterium]